MQENLLSILNEMFEESDRPQLERLTDEMSLRDDLNLDSLMLAELTVRIEAEYGVDLFEDGVVSTVGEVVAKMEKG